MGLFLSLYASADMIRRLATLFVVTLAILTHSAVAQISAAQKSAVNDLASSYTADHHVPGLSLAVVVNGRVALAEGYGLADIENNVPATSDTVYRIASVSKPVTAAAAMKLVEAGKLDLDAPIQKYCPAFPTKPWTITTRQLLTHQSGIRDYRDDVETLNTRHYKTINEALRQFANDPLQFEPGTRMQYTSYGYIVLGCVIEGASGGSYNSYMRQAIFEPSHMTATRLDDVFAIIPHRAHGYLAGPDGKLHNAIFVDVSNKPPGSGINSTATDMGNFVAALYSGQLISRPSLDRMLTAASTRDGKPTIYGYGMFVGGPIGNYRGMAEAGHGGDQQGYTSVLYLLPDKRFGVVVLTNLEGQSGVDLIGLSRKIYDICSPK
jgi:serine beta-lactamase-like protein LACTB